MTALAMTLLAACGGGKTPAPPGDEAWVATGASVTLPGSTVTPVDLATQRVETKVHVGSLPSAMVSANGGRDLLVVTQGTDMLHEIDTATGSVVHTVRVGVEPDAVAVTPGGTGGPGIALVANLDSDSVTPVDLGTWKAGKPIAVGNEPVSIAVDASGPKQGTAYVADFGDNQVTPINLATLGAGAPIAVGTGPETVAVSAPNDIVLVGNFSSSTVTVIRASTLAVIATVALPFNPTDIAVTKLGSMAYVCGGAAVAPLTMAGFSIDPPFPVPDVAQSIALDRDGATGWVALQSGSLVPVNLTTGRVGKAIHLGGHPSAVVIPD